MATYYVNPQHGSSSDANDGSDATTNSWATWQHAIDSMSNGDTCYLCAGGGNDEAPSATVTADDGVAPSTASSYKKFIGANSLGVEDDTRYIVDGGSLGAGIDILTMASDFNIFKNIELNNSPGESFKLGGSSSHPNLFWNCRFYNPAGACCNTYGYESAFINCGFISAGLDGFYRPVDTQFMFCTFNDNAESGCRDYHGDSQYIGCVFHNNGASGLFLDNNYPNTVVFNCVFDGNADDGIYTDMADTAPGCIIGNRFTNNGGYGINWGTGVDFGMFENWNFFLGNALGTINGTVLGGDNSLTSGTEGYADRANDDFNLTDSATLRRTAITMISS